MEDEPVPPTAEDEIRRLARGIDLVEGFMPAFAVCDDDAARASAAPLVARLGRLEDPVEAAEVAFEGEVRELLAPLVEALAAPSARRRALLVYGLERSVPRDWAETVRRSGTMAPALRGRPFPAVLAHMNLMRELFRERVPCPVVICLPDYAVAAFAQGAPDFWSWAKLYDLRRGRHGAAPPEG